MAEGVSAPNIGHTYPLRLSRCRAPSTSPQAGEDKEDYCATRSWVIWVAMVLNAVTIAPDVVRSK
jgi:hypothetical protein